MLHTYRVYYENADTDEPKRMIGAIMADTQTEALIKAALYYEHPQYDLVVEQAEITFVRCADTSKMHYTRSPGRS